MKIGLRPEGETGEKKTLFADAGHLRSVLVRRALLFTSVMLVIAAVVGILAGSTADNGLAINHAQKRMTEILTSAVNVILPNENVDYANGYAAGIGADGVTHPGTVAGFGTNSLEYSAGLQEVQEDAHEFGLALTSGARMYTVTIGEAKEKYLRGVTKIDSGSELPMLFVVDMPLKGYNGGFLSVLIGLFSGAAAVLVSGWFLSGKMLGKSIVELRELRDVAVRAMNGDLEVTANEAAPDEVGEMAKALNGLSRELSRNMYLLIVERNRLQNMLDGLSEGIVAIDSAGEITHVNPAVSAMFEQKRVAVGLPDARMKIIPDKSVWEDFDNVMRSSEPVTRNFTNHDMTIRMTLTPIVDEIGTTAGVVGLFSDITQMERLERTRREYVSNVSHELRTPLTAVRGLIEALKDGMVREEADRMRYYDIILRETLRLSRLINDQLELSRLQSGSVAIEKRRMNSLDDLIYDVCDRYHSIAEEHGLELNIESDLTDIPSVWANSDRVEQMLIILVDNAIKYTEKGSVNVSVEWDDEKVTISVRDTGIGIAEEDLPYVFDRFYKVDKAHSGKGSGLGLSIMTELLNRMHETVSVESEKGVGSKFSFTIHREPLPEEITE